MAIVKSKDAFKSGYKAKVTLLPIRTAKSGLSLEPIELKVSGNKTLPGFTDAETWTFNVDDDEQEIAETITGKFGGATALSYEIPYDPVLLEKLSAHAATNFAVQIVYDDTQFTDIYGITVHDCFLVNPGNTSGTSNNSAPNMTVTLQPRGGGKLADCMTITTTPRT
jgi:hypothetical protein